MQRIFSEAETAESFAHDAPGFARTGAPGSLFVSIYVYLWFSWMICMDVRNLAEVPAFITKDGSEIRELLAHRNSAIRSQSLAEARLPAGTSTQEHYHPRAEEIYYLTHGSGRIRIEGEMRDVKPGDAIAIPP